MDEATTALRVRVQSSASATRNVRSRAPRLLPNATSASRVPFMEQAFLGGC